jgi:uncharacterized protein YjiS (DUF1127 family)
MPDRDRERIVMTQAIERHWFERNRPFAILRNLIANWRKRRRLRELQHLSDHMLNDIGITRADLTAALGRSVSVDPVCELRRLARQRRQEMPDATRRWLNDRAFTHPKMNAER